MTHPNVGSSSRRQWSISLNHLTFAGGLLAASVGAGFQHISPALSSITDFGAFPQHQLSGLLLLVVAVYIANWCWAALGETSMMNEYLDEFAPEIPDVKYYTLALPVLLGGLVWTATDPFWFAAVYGVQKSVQAAVQDVRRIAIVSGLSHARASAASDDARRPAWDVIDEFYLVRRHVPLTVAQACLAIGALCVAAARSAHPNQEIQLTSAAYTILIVSLCWNESVYFFWRRRRAANLGGEVFS